jgi:hypothetical protein
MQMDGMRIFGGVEQLPDFDRIYDRIFGHGHIPMLAAWQHGHGIAGWILRLDDGNAAGFDGFGFGDLGERTEDGGHGASVLDLI